MTRTAARAPSTACTRLAATELTAVMTIGHVRHRTRSSIRYIPEVNGSHMLCTETTVGSPARTAWATAVHANGETAPT